jgi:hypothetical protein
VHIWAIANRLCRLTWKILHDGVSYIEQASEATVQTKKRRAQRLTHALRKLGYQVVVTPIDQTTEGAPLVIFSGAVNGCSYCGASLTHGRGSECSFVLS